MDNDNAVGHVLGIAGPSAGAKSTFAMMLQDVLGETPSLHLAHDDYYRDLAHLPLDERARQNFDSPEALETELLIAHLGELRAGQTVDKPLYDFSQHTRSAQTQRISPAPVVIVEGILVLAIPKLRDEFDWCIYVDTPLDICLARRILRDTKERGRSAESVIDQYLSTVRPMQEQWVIPSREWADIVVVDGELEEGVETVLWAMYSRPTG